MQNGTNTTVFIPVTAISKGKKATYLKIIAAFCPAEVASPCYP
jgi:hypothetical protein